MIARILTLLAAAIKASHAGPGYTYKGTIIFNGSELTGVIVHKSVVGAVVGAVGGLVVGAVVGLVVGAAVAGADVGLVVGAEVEGVVDPS
jgi:uncharacterized membrane protein